MNYFHRGWHRGSHAILLRVHEISIYRGGRGGGEGKGGGLIYHHLELSSLVRKNCSGDAWREGGREDRGIDYSEWGDDTLERWLDSRRNG